MLKIATWNVNSIKARLINVMQWLEESTPDIVLLQEIKTTEENFPKLEFSDMGYNLAVFGQKSYNGVAILSKRPIDDVKLGLIDNGEEEQARYIEAFISGIRIASIYLPNGNPVNSDKFQYKIHWMTQLIERAQVLFQYVSVVFYNSHLHDIQIPVSYIPTYERRHSELFYPDHGETHSGFCFQVQNITVP